MFGLEDGVVATAGGEFDLGGAVVEEFSGAIAETSSISSRPCQLNPIEGRAYPISRPA
jgi:hypothetical protein